MMTWQARIKPEVSSVATSRRRGGLVFTRAWLQLEEVPKEVLEDTLIEVREVPAPQEPSDSDQTSGPDSGKLPEPDKTDPPLEDPPSVESPASDPPPEPPDAAQADPAPKSPPSIDPPEEPPTAKKPPTKGPRKPKK